MRQRRAWWVAVIMVGTMAGAACTSSPDTLEADVDTADARVTDTGGVGDGDVGIESVPPDGYQCGGAFATPAELDGLTALARPDEERFAAAQAIGGALGERNRWGVLASDWLVDTEPLTVEGEVVGLVVVGPDGFPSPCVPVSTRQPGLAWGRDTPPVPPDQAALDRARCEAVAAVSELSVFWWDVPPGVAYEVVGEGQSLIGGTVDLLDGLNRALERPYTERLVVYGQEIGTAEDLAAAEDRPQGVFGDFGALGAQLGTARTYELRLTAAGLTRAVPCGQAAIPTELPVPACSLSHFGSHPQIDLEPIEGMQYTPDLLTVFRDGEPLTLGNQWGAPVDTTAEPGVSHRYAVELRDRLLGRAPVTTECGSIAATAPASDVEALQGGAELFRRIGIGPHLYGRAERDGLEIPLVMTYEPAGFVFVPGFPADESLNPYTIHDQLIAAIGAGRAVSFELDPASGLPRTWTLDGVTSSLTCISFDTQDVSLRPDTTCDPGSSLITPA